MVRAEGKDWMEEKCQKLVLGAALYGGKSTRLEIRLNDVSL